MIRSARLYWIGFTTFIRGVYEDISRNFILTIAPPFVMTALYFSVFGTLIGQRIGSVDGLHYRQYIAPGLIMLPVITSSYSQAALSFVVAKILRLLDEHLVSPQPGWMIVVCYVSGGVVRGILVGLAAGIVALFFAHIDVQHPLMMVGALLLTAVLSSLAGFINAVFARNLDQVHWLLSFAVTPLTYLGGVFYSLSLLPPLAQRLSLANPILYPVNLFRYGMLGVADMPVGRSVLVMLIAAVAMFGSAAILMRRGTGIRD